MERKGIEAMNQTFLIRSKNKEAMTEVEEAELSSKIHPSLLRNQRLKLLETIKKKSVLQFHSGMTDFKRDGKSQQHISIAF